MPTVSEAGKKEDWVFESYTEMPIDTDDIETANIWFEFYKPPADLPLLDKVVYLCSGRSADMCQIELPGIKSVEQLNQLAKCLRAAYREGE